MWLKTNPGSIQALLMLSKSLAAVLSGQTLSDELIPFLSSSDVVTSRGILSDWTPNERNHLKTAQRIVDLLVFVAVLFSP
jgi:hypothetical protein